MNHGITLINAHGPDHGLSVTLDCYSHEVTVRQWSECCEPDDHGSYSPHIQEATVHLRVLLDEARIRTWGKHADPPETKSMHGKIVDLALSWLCDHETHEEHVDDDDRPCDHFGMNYSGIGKRRAEPWPDHMTCSTCGGKPE